MSAIDVDSADTSQIEYDPTGADPWFFTHSTGNGGVFDSTLSEVHGPAGVVFRFNGTRVLVLGSVLPPQNGTGPPVSQYSMDGGKAVPFIATAPTTEEDGVTFFDSGTLPYGHHQVVINVTDASGASPYLLDYIAYYPTNVTQSSSSLSSVSPPHSSISFTGGASTTGISTSGGLSSSISTGSTPSSNSSTVFGDGSASSGSHPVGAIVGGVVGGVVGLVALLSAIFLFCKCRRNRSYPYTSAHRDTIGRPFSPRDSNIFDLPALTIFLVLFIDFDSPVMFPSTVTPYVLSSDEPVSTAQMSEGGSLVAWQNSTEGQDHSSLPAAGRPALASYPVAADTSQGGPSVAWQTRSDEHTIASSFPHLSPFASQPSLRSPEASQPTYSTHPIASNAIIPQVSGGNQGSASGPISGGATSKAVLSATPPQVSPPTQHLDSGIRFGPEMTPSEVEPVESPPMYTPN
ncbi:hypothetical protein AcV7_002920 [Taiwanofungus camphoratus]|nr:hypothetical protein AcW2_006049 [Antrodia cinnamomea]KAI0941315.1 hypothetical protein AcV7_002920 [Antrodia cinnamomea]